VVDSTELVWVNGRELTVPDGAAQVADGPRVVARFTGPIASGWQKRVEAAGGHIEFWCPPYGACITLTDASDASAADRLAALPFVAGFVAYEEQQADRGLGAPQAGPGRHWLDVICFAKADRPKVAAALRGLGAVVLDEGSTKIRIDWNGPLEPIRDIVGVKLVERPRQALPTVVGLATDIDAADAAGAWLIGLDGTGETIAIADTGLDTGDRATIKADVAGRVDALLSWPLNPSWAPFVTNPGADDGPADRGSGHGTYIAGIAAGDGAASAGTRRGVAPRARLVFQAMEQWVAVAPGHKDIGASAFMLAGRPIDVRDLFLQARAHKARVHVNAWGTPAHGAYDNDSYETDLFLAEHRDAVVLCASGNDGRDADANRRIDASSVGSPATAKNALTVGATEGSEAVGFFGTWATMQFDGRVFANPLDRADPVAGQPDRMALLSSAGPTTDGRIKPDVCAPGTDIVGPRSSQATGTGWGLVSPSPHYMADGGTSPATAVTGGAVALLRQAWRAARHGHAPSGPTLKALTVLGATPVRSRDGASLEDRFIAGFGRIDVGACLPATTAGETVRILANATVRGAARTGSSRTFSVKLPTGGRLRAVLQ